MREALIIIALLSVAIGFRLSKTRLTKKMGAFLFLFTTYVLVFYLTNSVILAFLSSFIWFLLPLVEIHCKRSNKAYPLTPKNIPQLPVANESFFPNASLFRSQLEEQGFDEVNSHSWQWLETLQHHRFFWNPEKYTIASICLCELDKVAFTYVIFHSELSDGTIMRTTNYPFTCPLLHEPDEHWKHVPCEEKAVKAILTTHEEFVSQHNSTPCALQIPDPEIVGETWITQFQRRAEHNCNKGLISINNSTFSFTKKGLLYIWSQAIKDLIRLC